MRDEPFFSNIFADDIGSACVHRFTFDRLDETHEDIYVRDNNAILRAECFLFTLRVNQARNNRDARRTFEVETVLKSNRD